MAKQHTSASKGAGAKVSNIRQAGGANKIGSDLEGAGISLGINQREWGDTQGRWAGVTSI